jgi:two-component sensor histidine kinase
MVQATSVAIEAAAPSSASFASRSLHWTARLLSRGQGLMATRLRRYSFAVIALALAFGARLSADAVLPSGFPFVTFFPAVVLTAFFAGVRLGFVSAAVSALLAWYFFIPPFHSFGFDGGVAVALAFYGFVVTIDLALIAIMQKAIDRLSAEEQRSAKLAEQRELLFQEMQHRVANNLAMISSLLNVQRRHVEDAEAKQALAQAEGRILLVSSIQRALHDPQMQHFYLGSYLERLTRDLIEAAGAKVDCRIACDSLFISGERATWLSLMAAELITNALKHGIAARAEGMLEIELFRASEPGWAVLRVRDNGPGMPEDAVSQRGGSLGMQIMQNLSRQLGAALHFANEEGTVAQLRFSLDRTPPSALDAAA